MKKYILLLLLISFIFPRRDCLQDAELDILGRFSSRPVKHDSTLSPLGYFYIHYDTTNGELYCDCDCNPFIDENCDNECKVYCGEPPDLTDLDGNTYTDMAQMGIGSAILGYAPDELTEAVCNAAKAGVEAIVQPGGSVKDSEVIEAADRLGLVMLFTGTRHFYH